MTSNAAMASFMAARMILEELTSRKPEQDIYKASLAECYSADRHHPGASSNPATADLEILEKAKKIQQALIESFPHQPGIQEENGRDHQCARLCLLQRLDYANASRCFEEVQQICQSLLAEIGDGPKPVRLLDLLALAQYNMAAIHEENRQFDTALELSEKSLANRSCARRCASVGNELSGKSRQ